MKKALFLFLTILFFYGCPPNPNGDSTLPNLSEPDLKKLDGTKNIILMIGDGMGLTQISAGMYMNGNQLNLEKFKMIGLHKSYASNDLITDSAAAATAFACGVKTYNGAIGVNPDTVVMKTILEEAEENGLKTGLVATSTIVHATPASFIAHQKQRKMYDEIAADFLKTDIDIFIGGGKKHFQRRDDGRDLYKELEEKGYIVDDYFATDFENVKVDYSKKFAYLTSDKDPLPAAQGRDYLIPASELAVDYLSKNSKKAEKGFFLMIEGSQIDWGGHANNSEYIISEMIEFDKAIGKVLEFAKKDGETLVIVTADHETGGYAINQGSTMDTIVSGFTSDYHTATMIPVFAYGPGSELFGGIYENTAIYNKMRKAFGFK